MDDTRAEVVTEVFVRLFEQGLIYRGKRLSTGTRNWAPPSPTSKWFPRKKTATCGTSNTRWWTATSLSPLPPPARKPCWATWPWPSTRRRALPAPAGQQLQLPLTGRTIPVIADDYVDAAFGTGFVKITPAHDFNDSGGQAPQHPADQRDEPEATMLARAQVFGFDGGTRHHRPAGRLRRP
jgi:valyl-tRNA synthetase